MLVLETQALQPTGNVNQFTRARVPISMYTTKTPVSGLEISVLALKEKYQMLVHGTDTKKFAAIIIEM